MLPANPPVDLLRRYTATPLEGIFWISRVKVRLATNSFLLQDRLSNSMPHARPEDNGSKSAWRIVVEPEDPHQAAHFAVQSLSRGGLALTTIGRKNFLAYDWPTQQGISFISENLVSDEMLFRQYFLSPLMLMLEEWIEAK
jgi:hypothetical protein